MDATEGIRREIVAQVNGSVQSDNKDTERVRLESEYGQVWDTAQVQKEFDVIGFGAPFVVVTRKSDSVRGSLMFQHHPRFYFSFTAN